MDHVASERPLRHLMTMEFLEGEAVKQGVLAGLADHRAGSRSWDAVREDL